MAFQGKQILFCNGLSFAYFTTKTGKKNINPKKTTAIMQQWWIEYI